MHPHNNCSICQGNQPGGQLHQDSQILVLVECMRSSASSTWEALNRKGYEIVKKPD